MGMKPLRRKWLAVGIILLLVGIAYAPAIAQNTEKPSVSRGTWLYVGGSGPGNYSKIIDALENASTNDTIFVYSGTYFESFSISISIRLIGEDKYTTIIDAQGADHVMDFKASWITVSGFTLTNTRNAALACGIYVYNPWWEPSTEHNIITNNIFTQHKRDAILIWGSPNNYITDNIFMNNTGSIVTDGSNYNVISNNTVIGGGGIGLWGDPKYNVVSYNFIIKGGITIWWGGNNIISNNTIENGGNILLMRYTDKNVVKNNVLISSNKIVLEESTNNFIQDNKFIDSRGISIHGDTAGYWLQTIENNSIDGKPIIYYKNQDSMTIPWNAGQVILAYCSNCVIENLTLSNVDYGIQLGFSQNNTIFNNQFNNITENAVLLQDSLGNEIRNNRILNSNNGIFLGVNSKITNIHDNTIKNCIGYGIYLQSSFNIISNNNVENNHAGLYIDYSYFNTITKNNFINNSEYHIYYVVNYPLPKSNKCIKNYYDNKGLFVKIIYGRVKSRFHMPSPEGTVYFYRPGLTIDWRPALKPYDIP
ncbi:MAG: hypothetical protein BV458_08560 [Thermoplasmata archaeon M9B2D]|nr:MAG: hypothetical protein BV458_08560 [Thermoplasmata archaeon M9B2D]